MPKNLAKTYNPKEFEARIYEEWENNKAFAPSDDHTKKPFTIVMPPPNITGKLHMGHALDPVSYTHLTRRKAVFANPCSSDYFSGSYRSDRSRGRYPRSEKE